jgi:hypothetical protein
MFILLAPLNAFAAAACAAAAAAEGLALARRTVVHHIAIAGFFAALCMTGFNCSSCYPESLLSCVPLMAARSFA